MECTRYSIGRQGANRAVVVLAALFFTGAGGAAAFLIGPDHHLYAEGYLTHGSSQAVATTSQDAWVEIDGCTSGGLNGWTQSACDLTAGTRSAGRYEIVYSVSFTGGNLDDYEFGYSINDAVQANCASTRHLGTAADHGNTGAPCTAVIADGDVIKPEARGTNASPDAISVVSLNFVLTKL